MKISLAIKAIRGSINTLRIWMPNEYKNKNEILSALSAICDELEREFGVK